MERLREEIKATRGIAGNPITKRDSRGKMKDRIRRGRCKGRIAEGRREAMMTERRSVRPSRCCGRTHRCGGVL